MSSCLTSRRHREACWFCGDESVMVVCGMGPLRRSDTTFGQAIVMHVRLEPGSLAQPHGCPSGAGQALLRLLLMRGHMGLSCSTKVDAWDDMRATCQWCTPDVA